MSDLKVCRICLCKGVKVYNYDSFHLKQYYEEIMAKKVNQKDGLPTYFCYECAAILYKFHKFKEKCWSGENTLKELLCSGSITLSAISQIDRQDKNLQSPIGIITVNKRVRTHIIKYKTLSEGPVKEIKNIEIPEIEECEIDNESDNSLDDKNLAEKKNELINEMDCFKEDVKTNIDNEESTEEKAMPDLEDDRMFSDNEDVMPENTEDVDKPAIKLGSSNETTVEERTNINTEFENSDNIIVCNKNLKGKKRKCTKSNKDSASKKGRKFEGNRTKSNYLDPKHWLKINLTEEEAMEEFRARAQSRKYISAAFQCADCIKGFSKEDILNRHVKLRHSETLGPVECRFCKMRFKLNGYLNRHIAQHYTKFKCLRCDLMCPLETTALFHNDYHNGVVRKCIHCGEEYRHLSSYYTHLRSHRSEYLCTLCGASFVSTMGLNMHKKTMHIINTVVVNVNPEEEVNTYCERCEVKFETRKAYDEHVFHSAKHTEGLGGLPYEELGPSMPKRRKKFTQRNLPQITPCTICNRNFPSQTAFIKHHTAEHKNVPPPWKDEQRHICEICGVSLAANSVASHLNTHTREKLYNCSTCDTQFNSKSSMTRHQLTHTGGKPFECSMCEKRFTQKYNMQLHYRTFHLKEPYPKRNRRKKAGIQQEIEEYRIREDSE